MSPLDSVIIARRQRRHNARSVPQCIFQTQVSLFDLPDNEMDNSVIYYHHLLLNQATIS